MTLRLLAVHAHPDDESSKGAATYAYYLDRGAEVMIVSCTGGERGSVLNEALEPRIWAERDIAGLRRVEMAAAQAAVGFEHRWLGYHDSGWVEPDSGDALPANSFGSIPVEISAQPLVKIIREYRPHVLITYDEIGGYPHPDHIRTHEVSMRAWELAADESAHPELGSAWAVSKLYYDRTMNPSRFEAVFDYLTREQPEHALLTTLTEMRGWLDGKKDLSTVRIPAGSFFSVRDAALRAHASQVAPDHPFFFWPNEVLQSAWPYEDYQLVQSRVAAVEAESDLFDGIEDTE
ncbi:mycothiol conjugate amidase Mca [Herbiconiux sp. P15]|uniref:mycothiol conjugate amidase Mca n=1 Tax=Herbiconiux liukaitaii TaxID=3342799 RepID=UPI0035B9692E